MPDDIVDKNLHKVIQLCYEMLELADHGDQFRRDTGCGIVYGMLRDVAYKVRSMAQKEISQHENILKTHLQNRSKSHKNNKIESKGKNDE